MGGINLVVYFVPTALENNVGLSPNLSLVIGGCVQVRPSAMTNLSLEEFN